MKYIFIFVSALLFSLLISSISYEMDTYTGVIINTTGNIEGSYLSLIIKDGSNRYIQASYILDTKIANIEADDLYEIYAIAGRNPIIIDATIIKNEIRLSKMIQDIRKPIILIL